MGKEQLRNGLKQLDEYIHGMDLQSVFLEESAEVPMDTLAVPLKIGEELSIDISCNFVETPEVGNILQFYGQLVLTEVLKEAADTVTENDILALLNELNRMVPVGQLLYLTDEPGEKIVGIRDTILTDLDGESEMKKCMDVLMMLTQVYELLCSSLLVLLEEHSVETTIQIINELLYADSSAE